MQIGAVVDAVSKQVAQPGKQLVDRLDYQNCTIAILDIGRVYFGTDQQTTGIGHNVSLAPFDLLGRIPRVAALRLGKNTSAGGYSVQFVA